MFFIALWNSSVFCIWVENPTLSTGSWTRLGTGSCWKYPTVLAYHRTVCLELCESVADPCSCTHTPKLQPMWSLGKIASPLFSLSCILILPQEGTSRFLSTPCVSLNTLKLLKQKPAVFKQLLLSALQLKLWRKEITIHKLISQQIILPHVPSILLPVRLCLCCAFYQ